MGSHYYRYILQIAGQDNSKDDTRDIYTGAYYGKLDKKAYEYRYGGGAEIWDESSSSFRLSTFHLFYSAII